MDSSCTLAFENKGPILHLAIVWRENPSFVTSHLGTQWVQEFLLTHGDLHVVLVLYIQGVGEEYAQKKWAKSGKV